MNAELRKGDGCSLEVTVDEVSSSGGGVLVTTIGGNTFGAEASDLRLIRRAPVDLATCPLPVKVLWGRSYSADATGELHHRGVLRGFVLLDNGDEAAPLLSSLRPIDAPAPAPDRSAENERLRAAMEKVLKYDGRFISRYREIAAEALASTAPACAEKEDAALEAVARVNIVGSDLGHAADEAIAAMDALPAAPTCPPCHIMIGDRAVPEPMREAPEIGAQYWVVVPSSGARNTWFEWRGSDHDRRYLRDGLIHSTEAAARTHAEAIIALSAKRGEV